MNKQTKTVRCKIYMAGDFQIAKNVIRKWTAKIGQCVTLTATEYIYTYGCEQGFIIGFINYPRFPSNETKTLQRAKMLGKFLMKECSQCSYTIECNNQTIYFKNEYKK